MINEILAFTSSALPISSGLLSLVAALASSLIVKKHLDDKNNDVPTASEKETSSLAHSIFFDSSDIDLILQEYAAREKMQQNELQKLNSALSSEPPVIREKMQDCKEVTSPKLELFENLSDAEKVELFKTLSSEAKSKLLDIFSETKE